MSGAASEVVPVAMPLVPAEAGSDVETEGAALVESSSDSAETLMAYDPSAHVPIVVIAVWVCVMLGLGAYAVLYFVPDLSKWLH